MTRLFKTAWVLLITAATLTFFLTGFTIYNFDDLEAAVEVEPLYCATVTTQSFNVDSFIPPKDSEEYSGMVVFKANCKACHRIDQKLIGPALLDVFSRVPNEEWLKKWIVNSSKVIASGDPYAVAIFEEYKRSQMTAFTQMSEKDLSALIAYLKYVNSAPIVIP